MEDRNRADTVRLKTNTKATFGIQLGGTGPRVTTILIDGEEGELTSIPEGGDVHVVWRPIEDTEYGMYATKIVYLSEAAVEARKKEAAEAEGVEVSEE